MVEDGHFRVVRKKITSRSNNVLYVNAWKKRDTVPVMLANFYADALETALTSALLSMIVTTSLSLNTITSMMHMYGLILTMPQR
jgi:hypothetical protein